MRNQNDNELIELEILLLIEEVDCDYDCLYRISLKAKSSFMFTSRKRELSRLL